MPPLLYGLKPAFSVLKGLLEGQERSTILLHAGFTHRETLLLMVFTNIVFMDLGLA